MGVTTNGTKMGLSATLPATFTQAAYAALTFTDISKVLDIGEVGKAFNAVTSSPVGQNYPDKEKGSFDIADVAITLDRIISDAGQVLVQSALDSNNSYAFKIALSSGNVGYFTAKVMKAATGSIATDSFETTSVSLMIDPATFVEA